MNAPHERSNQKRPICDSVFTFMSTRMRYRNTLLIWLAPSAMAILSVLPFAKTEYRLYPGPMGGSYTYSDSTDGGGSWSTLRIDHGVLRSDLHLDTTHATPFAGFGFGLTSPEHPQGLDFTQFDHVEIELRSPHLQNIGLILTTWIPGLTDPAIPMTAMFHEATLNASPIFTTVKVPLSRFSMAVWWPEVARIGASTPPVRMDLAKNFEMKMPPGMKAVRTDHIEVRSIRFVGFRWWLLYGSVATALFLSLLLTLASRRSELRRMHVPILENRQRRFPAPPSERPRGPVSESEPDRLELPNRRDMELQSLLAWIHQNYHKEEIGVEDAAKGSGISVRRIPQLLKDHTGKSFPGYVGSLRIAEACRLLRETDRQVSEISLVVGFSNSSHFHRVFKTETGESPSAWRERKTMADDSETPQKS